MRRKKLGQKHIGIGASSCQPGYRSIYWRWPWPDVHPLSTGPLNPWFRQAPQTRLTKGVPQQKTIVQVDRSRADFQSTFSSQETGNPVDSSCRKDLARTRGKTSQRNISQRPIGWPEHSQCPGGRRRRLQFSGHTFAHVFRYPWYFPSASKTNSWFQRPSGQTVKMHPKHRTVLDAQRQEREMMMGQWHGLSLYKVETVRAQIWKGWSRVGA